jgi:hypothetical protein
VAIAEVTGWQLSELKALPPDELAFWTRQVSEFVAQRNEAVKAQQEKARRKSEGKPPVKRGAIGRGS